MTVTLIGRYSAWQEVFSHMLDDQVLQRYLNAMSRDLLIEVLEITQQFCIHELTIVYIHRLADMITIESFPQVLLILFPYYFIFNTVVICSLRSLM